MTEDSRAKISIAGDDAWLESLLRADSANAAHIDDAGFSARVMSAIPPPRKSTQRWLVPVMAVLGTAVAFGLTPAADYFAASFVGLLDFRHLTAAHLSALVPVAVLYACSFAALRER